LGEAKALIPVRKWFRSKSARSQFSADQALLQRTGVFPAIWKVGAIADVIAVIAGRAGQ
jgi:hypothetical protein